MQFNTAMLVLIFQTSLISLLSVRVHSGVIPYHELISNNDIPAEILLASDLDDYPYYNDRFYRETSNQDYSYKDLQSMTDVPPIGTPTEGTVPIFMKTNDNQMVLVHEPTVIPPFKDEEQIEFGNQLKFKESQGPKPILPKPEARVTEPQKEDLLELEAETKTQPSIVSSEQEANSKPQFILPESEARTDSQQPEVVQPKTEARTDSQQPEVVQPKTEATTESQQPEVVQQESEDKVEPTQPEVVLEPENKVEPIQPEAVLEPENKVEPTTPEAILEPENKVEPIQPEAVVEPENKVEPTQPEAVLEPENKVELTQPEAVLEPENKVEPIQPEAVVEPENKVEPTTPEAVLEPENKVKPTKPEVVLPVQENKGPSQPEVVSPTHEKDLLKPESKIVFYPQPDDIETTSEPEIETKVKNDDKIEEKPKPELVETQPDIVEPKTNIIEVETSRDDTEYVYYPGGFCPRNNGKFPVFLSSPTDPTIFYICDWGKAFKFDCPAGLFFNPAISVCDWPYNVDV